MAKDSSAKHERFRALAAVGVLEAQGYSLAESTEPAPLKEALTAALAGGQVCQWTLSGGIPPEAATASAALSDAWKAATEEAARPLRLSVSLAGKRGAEHHEVLEALGHEAVDLDGLSVRRDGNEVPCTFSSPLRFGTCSDPRLTTELAEAELGSDQIEILTVTEDPVSVDLLLLPRPPADLEGLVQDVPIRDAGCVLMWEDPRAPLDLTADHVWSACHSAPSGAVAVVPLNRKQGPEWLELLVGSLREGNPLDVALKTARGRFGKQPFLVAQPGAAAAKLP